MTGTSQTITATDLPHLRRCIELAAEALEAGDAPFGSVLVDGAGKVLAEDRNRIKTMNDSTRHPEFELARWAATNMTAEARAEATVYTSGEHCVMCSAAHAHVRLKRIVYVASMQQFVGWLEEFKREKGEEGEVVMNVAPLPVNAVASNVEVRGPVPELEEEIKALHRRYAGL
ncbi:cytidine deaminase-like protein [Xylaria flabelliformis]|nr:cytidine deaminase-like protein [Xylaria flabelliformis]